MIKSQDRRGESEQAAGKDDTNFQPGTANDAGQCCNWEVDKVCKTPEGAQRKNGRPPEAAQSDLLNRIFHLADSKFRAHSRLD